MQLPDAVLRSLVLVCCRDEPGYGYGIVERIEEISGGHWSPSYGTIYPLLQRLVDDGLLEERPEYGDGSRKYYGLTDDGRQEIECLEQEREECAEKVEEMLLGHLHLFRHQFGEDRLQEVLEEFDA